MHIWTNGGDWVIAESAADAMAIWLEQTGEESTDYDVSEWYQRHDDKPTKLWIDASGEVTDPEEAGATLMQKPAGEWARQFGRGYLGSTDL